MASQPLTDEQIRDAFNLYEIGFDCGLSCEDSLRYSLQSLGLDDKSYIRKVFDTCVRLDHQGKETRVELLSFTNAMREAAELNSKGEIDIKEMYHYFSKGEKFDLPKLRDMCVPLGIRDRDVDAMYVYLAGEENDWVSYEKLQELIAEINAELQRVKELNATKSPKKNIL